MLASDLLGYDMVLRDYYSPIPNLRALPQSAWSHASALGGVSLDLQAQMAFLEVTLAPFLGEFNPPRAPTGDPQEFFLCNGTYEAVDAHTLYAMIRFLRPRRVIELGSGRSTQLIVRARGRNAREGAPSSHSVVDPFPTDLVRTLAESSIELAEMSATDVPLARFSELSAGDVLFVDTTHTVKLGGEVNYVVLEALPALAPGVVVHFHDVFLPWAYPRSWLADSRLFWAEQYLLQAFLAFNSSFEVLLAAQALWRTHPDRLARAIPALGSGVSPGAFWLRRTP